MRTLAKELVSLQPDVILTDSMPVTAALKRETSTIPIVFAVVTVAAFLASEAARRVRPSTIGRRVAAIRYARCGRV
jgi:ABC-type uncharacterized transport system substrate-binding protein